MLKRSSLMAILCFAVAAVFVWLGIAVILTNDVG